MAGQVCGVSQDIVPSGTTDRGSAADSLRGQSLAVSRPRAQPNIGEAVIQLLNMAIDGEARCFVTAVQLSL